MPPLLVRGVKEALAAVDGPVVLIANLLTEGSGMGGFTAADAARWVSRAIERPVDVVIANTGRPSKETLMRYAAEQKLPLELGALDDRVELVTGPFWNTAIPATIGGVCRLRCGPCSRSGCCSAPPWKSDYLSTPCLNWCVAAPPSCAAR